MKRKRIESIGKIALQNEQTAARELGESRRHLQMQHERLQELTQYREEYARRFQNTGTQGLDARKLGEYRMFLDRLNNAIEQQKLAIVKAEQECERREREWAERKTRTRALDKVVERYAREEQRQEDRREQKELDEHILHKAHDRSGDPREPSD